MKNILYILATLFIGGFFGLSTGAIYTASYKLTKRLIFICYFWILCKIINGISKGQKEPDKKGYPGDKKTKTWAKILIGILIVLGILGIMYLIGSGFIDNTATTIAERLSQHLHMEGGKTPRIGSSTNN